MLITPINYSTTIHHNNVTQNDTRIKKEAKLKLAKVSACIKCTRVNLTCNNKNGYSNADKVVADRL